MFTEFEKMWLVELLEEKIAELEETEHKGEAFNNDMEALNSALTKIKNLN